MDTFQDQETVVIYESETISKLVKLDSCKQYLQNGKGTFIMQQLIGSHNGQKVLNNKGTEYIYILRPTPTLITNTVDHKTQIIYHMDISQIILNLNLKTDSIVGESGTGSGSLSYSLSTSIPNGELHTFEFNQERYENAKTVLQQRLKQSNVFVYQRDVYSDGLYVMKEGQTIKHNYMDAVFLDLPKPWLAIQHAKDILKQNGRICCFSPCIEQVQKNCQVLRQLGFIDIKTIESLQRNLSVKSQQVYQDIQNIEQLDHDDQLRKKVKREFISHGPQKMRGHTAYLTFAILY